MINALIDSFRSKAGFLETELNSLIDAIHNGTVPDAERISQVDRLWADIRVVYDQIRNDTQEVCGKLEDNLSIDEYYTRYEASQVVLRKKQLENAREMLRRFLAV